MYDDDPEDHPPSAGPYQNNFAIPGHNGLPQQHPPGNVQHMATNGAHAPLQQHQAPQQHADVTPQFGAQQMNTGYNFNDPMLDADPFGLSASMHFPTQFSFDAR